MHVVKVHEVVHEVVVVLSNLALFLKDNSI